MAVVRSAGEIPQYLLKIMSLDISAFPLIFDPVIMRISEIREVLESVKKHIMDGYVKFYKSRASLQIHLRNLCSWGEVLSSSFSVFLTCL